MVLYCTAVRYPIGRVDMSTVCTQYKVCPVSGSTEGVAVTETVRRG